jgi:hypothetical protein
MVSICPIPLSGADFFYYCPVNILRKNGASEIMNHSVLTLHRKGWLPKVFP